MVDGGFDKDFLFNLTYFFFGGSVDRSCFNAFLIFGVDK